MHSLKAILFDLDGTLLDTAPDLVEACNQTLVHFGLQKIDPNLIKTKVTSGMRAMLSLGIAPDKIKDFDVEGKMRAYFANYYLKHIADLTKPFPSILDFCKKASLQGIKLAVITSKYENMALKVIDKFSFKDDFSLILGCDSTPFSKPDPRPILIALEKLGVNACDAIYIGDHLNDIKAANSAQVTSVAALWGYGENECGSAQTWGAKYCLKSPQELFSFLEP